MYEFHYDSIRNKHGKKYNQAINTEVVYEDLSKDKNIFYYGNYSAKSKYNGNSKILVVRKYMKQFSWYSN